MTRAQGGRIDVRRRGGRAALVRLSLGLVPIFAIACSSEGGATSGGGGGGGAVPSASSTATSTTGPGSTTDASSSSGSSSSSADATGSGGQGAGAGGASAVATSSSSGTAGGGGAPSGSGLSFEPNLVPGSDARLVWSGADMLPRTSHTAIWQAKYVQQDGYYAVAWHTSNDGTWHASSFEFGTHPYPTTGTLEASGQSTGGTGSAGAVHYYEIAGLGASDFIASPGPGPTYLVVKGVWVTQARTCEIVGDTVRHRYWPDVTQADAYIEQSIAESAYDEALALVVSPAFTFGGSPWTGDGVSNSESAGAVLRGFALFDEALPIADLVAEATSEVDEPVTNTGAASVWYINRNPTPDDVADKSGAGHSPSWANGQRPGLYQQP